MIFLFFLLEVTLTLQPCSTDSDRYAALQRRCHYPTPTLPHGATLTLPLPALTPSAGAASNKPTSTLPLDQLQITPVTVNHGAATLLTRSCVIYNPIC